MLVRTVKTVKQFMDKCKTDKISAYAAQTAFFIMLSAIPFLMVFSSLLQYTPLTEEVVLGLIGQVTPSYIAPFLLSIVEEVYGRSMGLISVTAVAAVWSASKGIHYMANGFNSVNDLEETRNWFVLRFWAVVYTLVFLVAIVACLVVLVFGNALADMAALNFPFLARAAELFSGLKDIVMFLVLILFFDVIFTTLPNCKLTFKSQFPGAVICSIAWYLFSLGVSIYVDYFNGFSMYGSLTTIALIMLWLYFCMYIMMLSAEINVIFGERFRMFGAQIKASGVNNW